MLCADFVNKELRIKAIESFLNAHGVGSLEEAAELCAENGIDVESIVTQTQRIAFNDVPWAYITGAAVAIKEDACDVEAVTSFIGEGLQAFCREGSVADLRKIGLGHGRLAARVLSEKTECFAFLAGHESFAAAEGAIGIAMSANKVRRKPLRVILNGLGKSAAEIISRINGFTYVKTRFDYDTDELTVLEEIQFSSLNTASIRCYGADEMREGVAIMKHEQVDVSISGNGTNMVKFQHPVAGAYKKWCNDTKKDYFACASGGGIGRTLNNDDISAGPASYGFTDMLSRMYADAVFAGSSSVPAHVEMMGFIGMGNNPMVGATVAVSVAVLSAIKNKCGGVE